MAQWDGSLFQRLAGVEIPIGLSKFPPFIAINVQVWLFYTNYAKGLDTSVALFLLKTYYSTALVCLGKNCFHIVNLSKPFA